MNARTQTHARTTAATAAPNQNLRAARCAVEIARRNYARAQALGDARARGAAARRLADAAALALALEGSSRG